MMRQEQGEHSSRISIVPDNRGTQRRGNGWMQRRIERAERAGEAGRAGVVRRRGSARTLTLRKKRSLTGTERGLVTETRTRNSFTNFWWEFMQNRCHKHRFATGKDGKLTLWTIFTRWVPRSQQQGFRPTFSSTICSQMTSSQLQNKPIHHSAVEIWVLNCIS